MRTKSVISGTAVLALTAGAVLSAVPAQASGDPSGSFGLALSSRTSTTGGMNLVPTPSGLGLGTMNQLDTTICDIGSGCAGGAWAGEFVGAGTVAVPEIQSMFISAVGIAPTNGLANRDQTAATNQLNYELNGTIGNGTNINAVTKDFNGTVTRGVVNGLDVLAAEGTNCSFVGSTCVNDTGATGESGQFRFVEVRKGAKLVTINLNVSQNVSASPTALTANFGPDASLANVVKKATNLFKKKVNWSKVPHTSMPFGITHGLS